jgi:hypothetical protein
VQVEVCEARLVEDLPGLCLPVKQCPKLIQREP